MAMWWDDNNQHFMPLEAGGYNPALTNSWPILLLPYVANAQNVYHCPDDKYFIWDGGKMSALTESYGYNYWALTEEETGSEYVGAPLSSCSNAGKTLLLSDSTDMDTNGTQYAYAVSNWGPEQPSLGRHNGWANCLFVDLHAEARPIVPDMQQTGVLRHVLALWVAPDGPSEFWVRCCGYWLAGRFPREWSFLRLMNARSLNPWARRQTAWFDLQTPPRASRRQHGTSTSRPRPPSIWVCSTSSWTPMPTPPPVPNHRRGNRKRSARTI